MDLMWTNPTLLLPEDIFLLEEEFAQLGKADTTYQAYWVADMEGALSSAQFIRGGDSDGDDEC